MELEGGCANQDADDLRRATCSNETSKYTSIFEGFHSFVLIGIHFLQSRQGTFNTSFTKASERDGEVFIAFFETMKEQFQRRSYTSVFQQFIKAVDAPHSYQQALDQFKASNSGSGADLPSGGALRVAMQLADAMDQGMQVRFFFLYDILVLTGLYYNLFRMHRPIRRN